MKPLAALLRSAIPWKRPPTWLTRLLRNEAVQGALVLSLLLVIFFSTPLLNFRTHHYSAADHAQYLALTSTVPGYHPRNALIFDTVLVFQPWLMYSRERIHDGELPLWNPYNGNGVPLIGNFQSAVFSIYSLPFYLLPFKVALLLSVFMKLFGIGLFSFLFFKLLGLRQISALTGATTFMFSSYNILWLGYPLTAAVIVLPSVLYFSERLFRSVTTASAEARSLPSRFWPLAGMALSLAVALLAGHPETFYGGFLLAAAYIAFRLADLWRQAGFGWAGLRRSLALGLALSAAGAVGAALAAVQLLPFFEYWSNSDLRYLSGGWSTSLSPVLLPFSLFPDLLGNPGRNDMLLLMERITTYHEASAVYVGMFVLVIAGIGAPAILLSRHRSRRFMAFFVGAAFVWLVYALDLFGLKSLFNVVPGVSVLLYKRTYIVWLFAVSAGAALFLDSLFDNPARGPRLRAYLLVATGLMAMALAGLTAYKFLEYYYPLTMDDRSVEFEAFNTHHALLMEHIQAMVISFGIGLASMTGLALAGQRRVKTVWGVVVLGAIFYQSGFWLRDYNPTIPDALFYPETDGTLALRETIQADNVAAIETTLVSAVNLVYKIPLVSSYDAIGVRHQAHLLDAAFDYTGSVQLLTRLPEHGLRLFSVDTVIVPHGRFEDQLRPDKFERLAVSEAHQYAIYRYLDTVPLYHIVYAATVAPSDDAAFELVMSPDFDPAQSVILTIPVGSLPVEPLSNDAASTPVEVLSEEPERIRLRATLDQSGYLVLAKTFYPDWRAVVNGVPQPVYQANYAFSAVALEPGENVIEYVYDPDSIRYGLWISGSILALGLIATGIVVFQQKRQGRQV